MEVDTLIVGCMNNRFLNKYMVHSGKRAMDKWIDRYIDCILFGSSLKPAQRLLKKIHLPLENQVAECDCELTNCTTQRWILACRQEQTSSERTLAYCFQGINVTLHTLATFLKQKIIHLEQEN